MCFLLRISLDFVVGLRQNGGTDEGFIGPSSLAVADNDTRMTVRHSTR
jgi:hypothetical protein